MFWSSYKAVVNQTTASTSPPSPTENEKKREKISFLETILGGPG